MNKKKILLSTIAPIFGVLAVGGAVASISTSCSKVDSYSATITLEWNAEASEWEADLQGSSVAPSFGDYNYIFTTKDDQAPNSNGSVEANIGISMSQKVDVSYVVTYNQDKANPHLVVNFPRPDSNPYYLPDHKVTVECWGSKDRDEPTSTTTFKKVKLNFVISYNTPTLV